VRKIITITGPRRAGKTTFLYQVMKEVIVKGADITDIIYINFEDERILPMKAEDLQNVLDAYFFSGDTRKSP
jgi:predicted AAA+ superfamily ATPase